MNIALRKLAMIEKSFQAQEEAERIQGYSTCTIDKDFRRRVNDLMDKVRII
ncbi:MAG: hypothetical protein NC408_05510 [Candidatus Gastranaerophilales bacterium]|nr:hypothetical protein [Candidatus Gastranaerophilales bacterium]MCM1072627.1 hypothetical protein [Bacteroides sp.]